MRIDNIIYLDHQATTPVDSDVFAEMEPYFCEYFANPHSSDHYLGWKSHRVIEDSATRIARLIGAEPDEIIFTSGATESNNLALLGLGHRMNGGKRRRILISAVEHKCVLYLGRVLRERYDIQVEKIAVDRSGFVEISALEDMLNDDVLAVSVMAVNNEIGTIQDVERIAKLARKHGAIFHCDAAQAPLAIPMESFALNADIISLSGHKMYGPKGLGVIYISRDLQDRIEPLVYGGGQQYGLRSGTIPVPLCVGMAAAAAKLTADGVSEKRSQLGRRRDDFVNLLKSSNWPIIVNGPDCERRHPGNANISFVGFAAQDILSALQPHLAASTGSACTSGIPEISHVLRAIGLNNDEAESSIRFSLGFDSSENDIEEAAALIQNALTRLGACAVENRMR